MRDLARDARVHIYDDQGDMLWGNNAFLAVYARHDGPTTLRFPAPVTVTDAYVDRTLAANVTEIELEMKRWGTRLLTLT